LSQKVVRFIVKTQSGDHVRIEHGLPAALGLDEQHFGNDAARLVRIGEGRCRMGIKRQDERVRLLDFFHGNAQRSGRSFVVALGQRLGHACKKRRGDRTLFLRNFQSGELNQKRLCRPVGRNPCGVETLYQAKSFLPGVEIFGHTDDLGAVACEFFKTVGQEAFVVEVADDPCAAHPQIFGKTKTAELMQEIVA